MLQGFRWQLIAFIIAIFLFGIGLIYRLTIPVTSANNPTITPTVTDVPVTETPTLLTPTATPIPTSASTQMSNTTYEANTYHEGIIGNIHRLNPIFAHLNPVDNDISSLIFEGLMKTNEFGEPIKNLVSDYVISSDGLEYVFTLRDDILWQDGQPFTANDVIYTMSLLSSVDYEEFSPTAKFWQSVETQKLTNQIIRFRLSQPLGSFTSFLTMGILPEHALVGIGVKQLANHPFNLTPIGTGAYQLNSFVSTDNTKIDAVSLDFSPLYSQRPEAQAGYFYKKLVFHLYNSAEEAIEDYISGQLSALANVSSRNDLIHLPDTRIYTQVESDVTMLIFNWGQEESTLFADRRVRQALSYGLDQEIIIDNHKLNDATFADSPLIPGSWAYRSNAVWTTFDISTALQLIESTNISPATSVSDTEGSNVVDNSFSILVQDEKPFPAIASDIANYWRQLGFEFTVEVANPNSFIERLKQGNFDVAIVTLSIGADPDVYRFWHPGQADNGFNYGHVVNNEVAELLELARQDNYGINRMNLYVEFQKRFAEQAIAIPLYYPLYTFVTQDSIKGIKLGFLGKSADRFRDIQYWQSTRT